MRLRDTRMHCSFSDDANPIILRESCWREATFQALAAVSSNLLLHTNYVTIFLSDTISHKLVVLFTVGSERDACETPQLPNN